MPLIGERQNGPHTGTPSFPTSDTITHVTAPTSIETPSVNKNITYTTMLLDTGCQVTIRKGYPTNLENFTNKRD